MKLRKTFGLTLACIIIFSSLLSAEIKVAEASSDSYTPIKWALIEIDTANNGLDNASLYVDRKYTQDLANIIRSFGFPFDVFRHQDLTSTTLQFTNGTIKYQALILERPDSSTVAEPTVEQKNWIKWAIGNGTNALFIKRSVQYFVDIFDGATTSISADSVTFDFKRNFAGYASGTTGSLKPTENVFLTLSSFAGDATEIIEGNYTTTFGPFLLNRTYFEGTAWFLAERALDHDVLGVMPQDATRTAFYYILLNELPKVPVYILPWQRYGSAYGFRIDDTPSPVMVNTSTVTGSFLKYYDKLVGEAELLKQFGYPATLFALAWGGNPPGSVQKVSLTSTEPAGYSNVPSISGYRVFGNLARSGNATGYKIVLYNGTVGGKYDSFKVDTDGDRDWGDETALKPGQNFTWYCEFDDYETTAFLAYNEAGWITAPSTVYFWTYIPITHQHSDKAASWAQMKNYIINLVDNYNWSIGLQGTDHAPRFWIGGSVATGNQWRFPNGTYWPVDYVQTKIQSAFNLLQQEFGSRVKKIMAYPGNVYGRTAQVQEALVNLGFISESYPGYWTTVVFPSYRPVYGAAKSPLYIPVNPWSIRNTTYAKRAWKYRGFVIDWIYPTGGNLWGLQSKTNWLNTTLQTNRVPYSFVYNETNMWVTSPYEASMFYLYSMQMLRNVKTAYWTGEKIVLEFEASSSLKNFVWRFPLKQDGRYFNAFSDNTTIGKIARVDSESVFVEFSQGQEGHRIEVVYGESSQYHVLEVTTTEGGTTEPVPGTYSYETGTVVWVKAYPSPNYVFYYWMLDGVNVGDNNPISVTLDENHALKAVFRYSPPPYIFDPSKYYTIREAEGAGRNYWVGGPGIFYDNETGIFWLAYRWRKPAPIRAHTLSIAKSTDGIHFTDVWSASKSELSAISLARPAILKDPRTGMFKLYLARAEPYGIYKLDDVWDPADFDPSTIRPVLTRAAPGEWDDRDVTYPWVAWVKDKFVMLYTGFSAATNLARLGLATSDNGESWIRHPDNPILSLGSVWDTRLVGSGAIMFLPDYWAVYYDGTIPGYYEKTYFTGLARWRPPPPPYRKLEKITVDEPLFQGTDSVYKTLRFLTSTTAQGKTFFYYEAGTEDGSVDLRVSVVERTHIETSLSTTNASLGDVVGVRIKLSFELPYTSATIVDKLPEGLSYWGGFADSVVPDAAPTVEANTLTYTTNKTGEHIITFNVKVTEAFDSNQRIRNAVEARYQATHYSEASMYATTDRSNLLMRVYRSFRDYVFGCFKSNYFYAHFWNANVMQGLLTKDRSHLLDVAFVDITMYEITGDIRYLHEAKFIMDGLEPYIYQGFSLKYTLGAYGAELIDPVLWMTMHRLNKYGFGNYNITYMIERLMSFAVVDNATDLVWTRGYTNPRGLEGNVTFNKMSLIMVLFAYLTKEGFGDYSSHIKRMFNYWERWRGPEGGYPYSNKGAKYGESFYSNWNLLALVLTHRLLPTLWSADDLSSIQQTVNFYNESIISNDILSANSAVYVAGQGLFTFPPQYVRSLYYIWDLWDAQYWMWSQVKFDRSKIYIDFYNVRHMLIALTFNHGFIKPTLAPKIMLLKPNQYGFSTSFSNKTYRWRQGIPWGISPTLSSVEYLDVLHGQDAAFSDIGWNGTHYVATAEEANVRVKLLASKYFRLQAIQANVTTTFHWTFVTTTDNKYRLFLANTTIIDLTANATYVVPEKYFIILRNMSYWTKDGLYFVKTDASKFTVTVTNTYVRLTFNITHFYLGLGESEATLSPWVKTKFSEILTHFKDNLNVKYKDYLSNATEMEKWVKWLNPFLLYTTKAIGNMSSFQYTGDKLKFTVTAPPGITSQTKIYVGEKGKPISVSGATSWSYDAQTKTVQVTVTHTSSAEIVLNWPLATQIEKSFSSTSANLGEIVGAKITLNLASPYTSVTIVDKLPNELSYSGGFADSLAPSATPIIRKNTVTYATNKTGEHVITFNVKVTKAYDHNQTITNIAEATYKATSYPDAQLTTSAELTIKSFKASFDNSKTAGPDSITANTSATWEITVTINNPYNYTMNAIVKENFGAHLKVSILSYSSGTPTLYTNKRGNQYRLLWSVSVNPEDTATLVLQITTTGIEKDKELSRGATIKFLDAENTKLSAKTSPITVTVLP